MDQTEPDSLLEELSKVRHTLGWMDLVIGSISDGVCVVDQEDRLLFANDYFADLIGASRIFLLGQKMQKVFPIQKTARPLPEFSKNTNKLSSADGAHSGIYELPRHGNSKVFKISSRPLPDIKQKVFLIQDITREYEFAQAKNKFVDLASHQLRTPMTAIMTYAHLLQDGFGGSPLEPGQQKLVATIVESSERMIGLVNGLLNITRAQNGLRPVIPDTVLIADIFKQIQVELKARLHKKNLTFIQDIPEYTPPLISDQAILHEIFSNLVVNAVQYTPEGGTITAAAACDGDYFQITISDTGIGIPEAHRPHLFEQFSRADNAHQSHPDGTGLGLYLIKILLGKVDGNINFTSEVGRGTSFTVTLPARIQQAEDVSSDSVIDTQPKPNASASADAA